MPPLVRRYVKTSIAFLVLGLLIGLHMGAASYLGAGTLRHGYVVAHTHLLLIGFLIMLIMGISLWMFPRVPGHDGRSSPRHVGWIYWAMTLSVVARCAGEIAGAYVVAKWPGMLAFASSAIQSVAITVFFMSMLPRVRSPRDESARGA